MTAPRRSWSRFAGAGLVILCVSAGTAVLEHLGALDRFETAGLDAFNLLQPVKNPISVVMIGITDEDYNSDLFKSTSPLACASIRRVIAALAEGRPSVIAVDLDTSSGDFGCLANLPPDWPPIVWAQDAIWHERSRSFEPLPLMGGAVTLRTIDSAGLIQFPQDGDGVIRRYVRELPLTGPRAAESFPWVVVGAACGRGCAACCEAERRVEHEALRLNFSGERFNFSPLSVGNVLKIAEDPGATGWKTNGPLAGRIALLGGSYRAARDVYVTPVGPLNGVQILAQAIESEAHHGGIRPMNEWLAIALEILSGVLLVVIHHHLHARLGLALAVSLLLMPVLTLASSLAAFSTLALWFNFVPMVVSVLIHQLWEHAREYQKLKTR